MILFSVAVCFAGKLSHELKILSDKYTNLEGLHQTVLREKSDLEKQLNTLSTRYQQLEAKFKAVSDELEKCKETIRSLNQTISELKANLDREMQARNELQRR